MSYRQLVLSVGPAFLPLGLLARLPYAIAPVGILLLLQSATGSYAFAGITAGVQSIAVAVGGILTGALAGRFGPRRLGVAAALVNTAATVGLIVASQSGRPAMVAAAIVAGLTQPQVGPLVRVQWSHLLRAGDRSDLLPTALSYEAAADETSFVAGPAIAGLLAVIATPFGPIGPLAGVAVLLVGAALPFAMFCGGREPVPQPRSSTREALPRGPLGAMFVAMAAMGVVFGSVLTGVSAHAVDGGHPGAAGLLYAELGVGSALAGVACAWLPRRCTLRQRYVASAATLLAGMVVLAVGVPVLPVAIAVAGVTIAPYMISLYALTERLVPGRQLAVAMTVLCAGGPVGSAVGQSVAGSLVDAGGSAAAFVVAPVAAAAALLLALALLAADRHDGRWLGGVTSTHLVPASRRVTASGSGRADQRHRPGW